MSREYQPAPGHATVRWIKRWTDPVPYGARGPADSAAPHISWTPPPVSAKGMAGTMEGGCSYA